MINYYASKLMFTLFKPSPGQRGREHASGHVFGGYEFDPTPYSK